ncbi:MAG: transpeptidase family protein [Flavobacteriales bacterium]|nr:transpeptidase family protein [Flavobacteriales bacterium]
MNRKADIIRRALLLYVFTGVFALAILARVVYIQFFIGPELRKKTKELTLEYRNVEALRGNIFSSDGNFLAISVPVYELRMDTKANGLKEEKFNNQVDSLAWCLSNLFRDRTKADYKSILTDGRRQANRYLLLRKGVSFSQLQKALKFPLFRDGANGGGIIAVASTERVKPYKNLAARTIGKNDPTGKPFGIEGAFNEELTGKEGVRLMQKLTGGMWKPVDDNYAVEPENGADIYTTLDVTLQDVAHSELYRQLSTHNADHGCVVMMEVQTGEVKAIANLKRTSDGSYIENYNYAVGESVEPGSTFKLASMMALMEDGYVKLTDSVNTGNGQMRFYSQIMKDSHEGGYGWLTMKQVFEKSSNVGVSMKVWEHYKNDPEKFIKRIRQFHLHEPLGLQIPGEGDPRIKNPKDRDWSGTTLPWMSIGYESKLTPLQVLTFYNAVANNGKMVRPIFVKEIRRRGAVVKTFGPEVIEEKIASEKTIAQAREMMEGVVKNGTARNLNGLIYKIGGKTGTAQIAGAGGYKNEGKVTYRATFVGYFPADEPKYSCIVVVSAPSNSVYYGNLVAGPIFKAVADKVYAGALDIHKPYNRNLPLISDTNFPTVKKGFVKDAAFTLNKLNITNEVVGMQSGFSVAKHLNQKFVFEHPRFTTGLLPDVKGMGARDAIFILESLGMKVKVNGKGAVREQTPQAGNRIIKGQTVIIQLG